ncbi:unnamed protein product [Acanthoscelides obtectus]|uniref:Uncharacterized protein n=1 Tax=Acanthoscelides obtectus TaxID=200917 RepID=A0A9P0M159_ACAOB|nr:unnamed protein product [Acanthoscelides obtectus]CAK1679512.1 hypothetical protein AOBTE_LOCUS32311 [Acanthoscelides obtectus]
MALSFNESDLLILITNLHTILLRWYSNRSLLSTISPKFLTLSIFLREFRYISIPICNQTLQFCKYAKVLCVYRRLHTLIANKYLLNSKLRRKLCESLLISVLNYCNLLYVYTAKK